MELQNLAAEHPEINSPQAGNAQQPSRPALATSVQVGDHTYQIGRLMTILSDHEAQLLHGALHPGTQKEHLSDETDKPGLINYAIGAKDYFSSVHLPQHYPPRMVVTCAQDNSQINRLIISDPPNKHVYCDARFESPAAQPRQDASPHPQPLATQAPAVNPLTVSSNKALVQATGAALRLPNATPMQIDAHLRNDDGSYRYPEEVAISLHTAGLRASDDKIGARLRAAGGVSVRSIATPEEIDAYLRNGDGSSKSQKQVIDALRKDGFGAGSRGVERHLPDAGGRGRRPGATDKQIDDRLHDDHGELRNQREIRDALHKDKLGADTYHISARWQLAGGVPKLPRATDDDIDTHSLDKEGSLRAPMQVVHSLNAAGLGVGEKRVANRQRAALGKNNRA